MRGGRLMTKERKRNNVGCAPRRTVGAHPRPGRSAFCESKPRREHCSICAAPRVVETQRLADNWRKIVDFRGNFCPRRKLLSAMHVAISGPVRAEQKFERNRDVVYLIYRSEKRFRCSFRVGIEVLLAVRCEQRPPSWPHCPSERLGEGV